jgi:hypothetical protein
MVKAGLRAAGGDQPLGDEVQGMLRLIQQRYPNTLLIGPDAATEPVLCLLQPLLRPALFEIGGGRAFELPVEAGTVILRAVHRLTSDQQHALLRWIDTRLAPFTVVSTAEESLYGRVTSGEFISALYYRLNIVTLDLRLAA